MGLTSSKSDSHLVDHYHNLADDQLLRLWQERNSLTQEARLVLVAGVEKGHLVSDLGTRQQADLPVGNGTISAGPDLPGDRPTEVRRKPFVGVVVWVVVATILVLL